MQDIYFWLYFLLFICAVFIAFFIPGDLALRRLQLSLLPRVVLGIITGMVLWAWQGVTFGYLNLRWFTIIYLLFMTGLWLKLSFKEISNIKLNKIQVNKSNLFLFILIGVGMLLQVSVVWFTGVETQKGMYFCCGNTGDSLFHAALTSQLVKSIPPTQPGMVGVVVHNYHYWSNIVVAELVRVFNLPLFATQFQYTGVLISLLYGLSAVVFARLIKLDRRYMLWLLFFLYFGGDVIAYLLLAVGKGFIFNMSSLEDGAKFLVNPPRAFSIVIFFAGLSMLHLWIEKKKLYAGMVMVLLLGTVIGFKVYTGLLALAGLACLSLYFLLKRQYRMLIPIALTFIISFVVYYPVNTNAGGLYFTRFWLFENFVVQPTLGLERFEQERTIYEAHNNWLRVVQYELMFFLLYTVSLFGTKLLGVFQSKKSLSHIPREIHIFLLSGLWISAVGGFFFQQTSGGANTFNFLVNIFILGSIYTALACYFWLPKFPRTIHVLLATIIIIVTIPRVLHEWKITAIRWSQQNGFILTKNELQAMTFLKEKTGINSLILVDNRKFEMEMETPYISIFTDRPMYLSGDGILRSHGNDTSYRRKVVETIIKSKDRKKVETLITENNISYIYMSAADKLPAEKGSQYLKTAFKNDAVRILKVTLVD